MTLLLSTHGLSKSYGTQTLFKQISFTLSQGDRIGLVGPNGSGKSTLLKILIDQENPDEGNVSKRQGLRIGYAPQNPEFPSLTLEEVLVQEVKGDEIELLTKARILLGKAQFTDYTQNAMKLSGGWKKRLDILRALMRDPDLLLLDEPTNHLDLEGILWLEKFLLREKIPYVVVSHDRYFLENISSKIIELNRCYPQGLFISEGGMNTYTVNKEAFLNAQEARQRSLSSLVRNEEDWLRRSPKARTTKAQSRIDKAYELQDELADLKMRNKVSKVNISFSASERETRKLLMAKSLSKSLGGKQLFKGIDIVLSPGSRLGIVGKNGTGKTTLLKVLSGAIPQDSGTIKWADDLKIVYFDQHRELINPDLPLRKALSPSSDYVRYRGQDIHVNGWAKKFLFTNERLELPVRCLSGGERARILLARLMLEEADILFLDEPTNDIDIPTLEVIEESLREFDGAVILISHDRCLMDRICTQLLGLDGPEQQFYADYSQWEKGCLNQPTVAKTETVAKPTSDAPKTSKKLSYKEQKELEGMEASIHTAENEIFRLQKQLETEQSLDLYRQLSEAQLKLESLFERWQELENKRQ